MRAQRRTEIGLRRRKSLVALGKVFLEFFVPPIFTFAFARADANKPPAMRGDNAAKGNNVETPEHIYPPAVPGAYFGWRLQLAQSSRLWRPERSGGCGCWMCNVAKHPQASLHCPPSPKGYGVAYALGYNSVARSGLRLQHQNQRVTSAPLASTVCSYSFTSQSKERNFARPAISRNEEYLILLSYSLRRLVFETMTIRV